MLSKPRIGAICYFVSDLTRTEAFYRDVLGLNVQRMEDDEAGSWLMAKIEDEVELIFFVVESKPGNTPIVVFDLAEGGNSSLIHIDWMIGSGQVDIDGVRADGSRVPVMRKGEWA